MQFSFEWNLKLEDANDHCITFQKCVFFVDQVDCVCVGGLVHFIGIERLGFYLESKSLTVITNKYIVYNYSSFIHFSMQHKTISPMLF